jgi:endoglucanase
MQKEGTSMSTLLKRCLSTVVTMAMGATMGVSAATAATPNYGEALQKSIYFYEAQQAGKLPAWNRVPWRDDSVLKDGADVGLNLSGGWFDAGDHVKFGFPMAGATTMLAWGGVDYRDAYTRAGQLDDLLNNLRFVNDFFIAAHPSPNVLYGQVGQGNADHAFWGPPEVADLKTGASRTSYKIDLTCKGPDLAAETAAAMAASSMVFKQTDSAYAATLLIHAKQLYSLALATIGTDGVENNYANCITDAKNFYNAAYGVYWDEMAWGALWMYRATGDAFYLTKFREFYPKMGSETGTTTPVYTWSQGWNDKAYGTYALAAVLLGDAAYHTDTQRYLDFWSKPTAQGGGVKTTGGLIVVDRFNGWGTTRYAANTAFIALYYGDRLGATDPKTATYKQFGEKQINYILGDNPRNSSYMVGFGNNPPINVHHRGAHGSWGNNINLPTQQRHIIYGALAGGPSTADDFAYADDRTDFKRNEVAVDYNAGLTSALARMTGVYGGTPIPDAQFPPADAPTEEFLVGAKVNASGTGFMEIKAVIQNKSTTPAQSRSDLRLRYFVDLTELYAAGFTAANVTVNAAFNQGSGVSQMKPWGDPAKRIFYTEVAFDGVAIYPGGLSEFRKEVQFRMSVPATAASLWNNANDPSWDPAYTTSTAEYGLTAPKIPIYGGSGERLFGQEPVGATCGGTTGVNCLPVAVGANATTVQGTAVTIALNGSDSDGTIATRTIATQPSSGVLSGTGATRVYTPNATFTGSDSFTFTVTDNAGSVSAPATVNITVTPIGPVNRPPTACFAVVTAAPTAGASVAFNASCTSDPDNDPLTYSWSFGDSGTGTGSLATHTYAAAGSFVVRLTVNDGRGGSNATSITVPVASSTGGGGGGSCTFSIQNQWGDGFVAKIVIANTGTTPINGWTVGWAFADGSTVANLWNATLSGANPYTASSLSWNSTINPGQSIEFGFQGRKGVLNGAAPTVTITGAACR